MADIEQADPSGTKWGARDIVILAASVLVIIAGMAWYVTYDRPSGKHPSVIQFVMFHFRELLLLGLLLLVFAAIAIQKLFRMRKRGPKT